MESNHRKIKKELSKDKVLSNIISLIELEEIKSTGNVFHDLMSCIIEQQIHYRSTKGYFKKLLDHSNLTILSVDNFEEFERNGLSDVKLSGRKFETINNVLDYFSQADIKWKDLTDNEIKHKLKEIKGIGNWTIDMILIYTLKREDIFPLDDYHIKQSMSKLYEIKDQSPAKLKKGIEKISMSWSPYRSIGFRYLIEWKSKLM